MLFTNVSINATLLTMCHTSLQLIHYPDKHADYDVGKPISKQTSMKVMNSGTATKRWL